MSKRLFMIVERFKGGEPSAVYKRFYSAGRMLPDGLDYKSSWVDEGLTLCYQLMETDDPNLLQTWIGRWQDLIDFEVHALLQPDELSERLQHLL